MKTLLPCAALALLPALAGAQSNLTLWGFYKTGIASTRYDGAAEGNGSHTALADGSSRFVIRGSEDLGGGLQGTFQIDNRFRGDDGVQSLATGNTFVGLSGSAGALRLGRLDTYYHLGIDQFRYLATPSQASNISLLSYVGDSTNAIARASRAQNMVRYDLPSFAGIRAGLNWSPAAAGSEGAPGTAQRGQAWAADAVYRRGPLSIGMATWSERSEGHPLAGAGAITGQRAWRALANYDFGFAKAGFTWDDSRLTRDDGDTRRVAWSLPLSAKLGRGTLLVTYTRAGDTRTGGARNQDTGARMLSVGYDHPLSRRTAIGLAWSAIDNDASAAYGYFSRNLGNLPAPAAGQDQRQLYLGLRHAF